MATATSSDETAPLLREQPTTTDYGTQNGTENHPDSDVAQPAEAPQDTKPLAVLIAVVSNKLLGNLRRLRMSVLIDKHSWDR